MLYLWLAISAATVAPIGPFSRVLRRWIAIPVIATVLGVLARYVSGGRLGISDPIAVVLVVGRRVPGIWLGRRLVPALHDRRDTLFVGWFGPIGISSLFYATPAVQHGAPGAVWHLTTLVIAWSVLIHGATPRHSCGGMRRAATSLARCID